MGGYGPAINFGPQMQHNGSGEAALLNGLNAAANQEADRQQRQAAAQAVQDHQNQQDIVQAMNAGWVLADAETRTPEGMIDRSKPSTPDQDPSRIQSIGGKRMYKPTDLQAGKAFVPHGGLADALMQGGGWDGKTPLTDTQSHSLMMAINEAQPKDERSVYDNSGKYIDAKTGKGVPGFIGEKTHKFFPIDLSGGGGSPQPGPAQAPAPSSGGAPGGAFDLTRGLTPTPAQPGAQPGAAPAGADSAFSFAPPEKPEKPDVQSILPGQQGPNGGVLVFDKNSQSVKEVPLPKGSKATMTPAQTEADKDRHVRQSELQETRGARLSDAAQRRADAQSKVEELAARNHEAEGVKKDNMQAMAQGYQDAMGTPAGGTYFPPRLVNGIVVPGPPTLMPEKGDAYNARITDLGTTARGFKKTAATHEAEQKRIEKARGWGEFAPAQTAQPQSAAPAKPAQPTAKHATQRTAAPAAGAKADPLGIR